MYESFTPGQQSVFKRTPTTGRSGKPYVDALTIIDFTDDTARVNALLGGQVQAIDNLPTAQIAPGQGNPRLKVLIVADRRVAAVHDARRPPPFNDVRVRQAMRLIVNRPQMIEQVLSGQGRDRQRHVRAARPGLQPSLPQRHQDIEQAKSLLKAAGHEGLTVQLTTAPVFQGVVQAAEVFAQQATGAGVNVKLARSTPAPSTGPNTSSGRSPRTSGPPANTCRRWRRAACRARRSTRPTGAERAGEVHQADRPGAGPSWTRQAHPDPAEAQAIEYDTGGYIIPYFSNQIDAYSSKLAGFIPAKSGFPLGNYWFKNVGYTS